MSLYTDYLNKANKTFRYLANLHLLKAEEDWTLTSGQTYTYEVDFDKDVEGVSENGTAYTEKTSIADVEATASSYYFDSQAGKVYIHTSDGTNPSNFTITISFVLYFTNKQSENNLLYSSTGYLYEPYLNNFSIPYISQEIKLLSSNIFRPDYGSLKIAKSSEWYNDEYVFINKKIELFLGEDKFSLDDFEKIFVGFIDEYAVAEDIITFSIRDVRLIMYKQMPPNKYWSSNYPNLDERFEGAPIPIVYGQIDKAVPVCIDTTINKFKLADHEIMSIDAVYINGEETTDYTADLTNGEFTITATIDYEIDKIEVDFKGKKDNSDNLINNASDILVDLLKTYLGLTDDDLDLDSFATAKAGRTQELALHIGIEESLFEIIRRIEQSVLGYLIVNTIGTVGFYIYSAEIPVDIPVLNNDIKNFLNVKDDEVYYKVTLLYDRDSEGLFKKIEATNNDVKYKYNKEETITIETYLKDKTEAKNILSSYKDFFQAPLNKVKFGSVDNRLYNLKPSDKIIINGKGFENKTFRILSITKDFANNQIQINAVDDLQSIGETLCAICYTCQSCVSAENDCQVCDSCQNCNTDQGGCNICNTCQSCDTDQGGCLICDVCQTCVAVENPCSSCNTCQNCNTDQGGCQDCNTCQICVSSEGGCINCNTCQNCDSAQEGCVNCNTCQNCNTNQGGCQVCDSCQNCNTDQNVCCSCQSCDSCQTCDACQFCVTCEATDVP